MNILFVIITPGSNKKENTYALVPSDKVGIGKRELDRINNVIVDGTYFRGTPQATCDRIIELYKRFGLEPGGSIEPDLKAFLKPDSPFIVDRVITIGWSV